MKNLIVLSVICIIGCLGLNLKAQNNFLDFDGVDDRVESAGLVGIAGTQQFTIELWARLETIGGWEALFFNALPGAC